MLGQRGAAVAAVESHVVAATSPRPRPRVGDANTQVGFAGAAAVDDVAALARAVDRAKAEQRKAAALLARALGADALRKHADADGAAWLRTAVADAAKARRGNAAGATRAKPRRPKAATAAAPGFSVSGGRMDAYYATLGLTPEAYVYKAAHW